jgi:hypothetical protein
MIECSLPLYPGQEAQVNDLASGLFNTFLGIGQVLGPLYGSFMTRTYGFKYCCDSVALICLVYSILYYTICDGYNSFGDSRWRNLGPDEAQLLFEEEDDLISVKPKIKANTTYVEFPHSLNTLELKDKAKVLS